MPLATEEFRSAARVQASQLGLPDLEAVFVAHPIQDRTEEEMQALADLAIEDILKGIIT